MKLTITVLKGIKETGGKFENYNSNTGEPLSASNIVGQNLLVGNVIEEALTRKNPFEIK